MIPRFKPYLGKEEILAAFCRQENAVARFEEEFASTFEAKYALAFPYGRSALWAFFKALGIKGAEVIMPAYTCVVVAHAAVLSNNIPRFVDITLYDYNMDLDRVEAAINERTRAIIATHLFGYPLNVDRLSDIVRAAEARWGHKIWVVQDCAHAFGACRQGKLVCNEGDMAFFGLNISKMINCVFGGMITTNDSELYMKLRSFRDKHFVQPGLLKQIRRFLYLMAVYPAFNDHIYGLVNWLQEDTPLLDRFTKAYHLDGQIHFPPDYLDHVIDLEARVGLVQLQKYPEIVRSRRVIACYYDKHLKDVHGLTLPPIVEGASYSHYVPRLEKRKVVMDTVRWRGVQLGRLIDYSIPHMANYQRYEEDLDLFPNSVLCSRTTINLPEHSNLTEDQMAVIVSVMRDVLRA